MLTTINFLTEYDWIDIYNCNFKINHKNNILNSTKGDIFELIDENNIKIKNTNIKGIIKQDENKIIWNNNTTWFRKIYNNLELCYTDNGGPIYIYGNDYYIVKCLKYNKKVWEEHFITKMLKYIKKSKNVLDIGAHVGSHSLYYSRVISGNVYAFEAQKKIYDILEKNIKYQNKKNIKSYHYAIGHLNNFEVSINNKSIDNCNLQNGIEYDTKKDINYGGVQLGDGGEKVIMRTIDSFEFKDIDYIKIDVEGCEELVLYGALKTIEKYRPVIVFEYRNDKTITPSMKKIMPIDDNIINLKTVKYIEKTYDYKFIHDYTYLGNDSLLLPKEKEWYK